MIILLKQKSKEFEKLINLDMTTWEGVASDLPAVKAPLAWNLPDAR